MDTSRQVAETIPAKSELASGVQRQRRSIAEKRRMLSFRPLGFLFLLHGRLAILLQGSISLSFAIALRVL
jgi:hypothetical protein